MVEEVQRQRAFPQAGIGSLLGGARTTTLPNKVDALAKQQYDWNRANTEFSRFHAKSDPTAQRWEQAAYDDRAWSNPTFVNARSPRVFRNTQWSPNYPGPKFDTRFLVGSRGSSSGLKSMNRRDYYDQMKGSEQNWMDILKGDVRQGLGISNEPAIKAGITNPNLGGAKVMNAGLSGSWMDPTREGGWMDRFGKWMFGKPNDTQPPPVGEGGELLPGWKLDQDGTWNYYPPEYDDNELPFLAPPNDEQFPLTMEAKVNLLDVQDRIGGDINWNKFIRDLESRVIEYGNRGGLMSLV